LNGGFRRQYKEAYLKVLAEGIEKSGIPSIRTWGIRVSYRTEYFPKTKQNAN